MSAPRSRPCAARRQTVPYAANVRCALSAVTGWNALIVLHAPTVAHVMTVPATTVPTGRPVTNAARVMLARFVTSAAPWFVVNVRALTT